MNHLFLIASNIFFFAKFEFCYENKLLANDVECVVKNIEKKLNISFEKNFVVKIMVTFDFWRRARE